MAPCLSKFPSLCLEAMFKHVPLEDLLRTVGLVCTAWYKSRRTELMRRRRLVIVGDEQQLETFNYDFISDSSLSWPYETDLMRHVHRGDGSPWLTLESLDHVKFNSVVAPKLTIPLTLTSSLVVMSNITDLSFVSGHASNSTITQVIRLVAHFSQHLVCLKLSFKFNGRKYKKNDRKKLALNMTTLFALSFNQLLSLRHFRFDLLEEWDSGIFANIRPEMSFLSRLNTVSIFFEAINGSIISSLSEHALNVGSIDLHNMMEVTELLKVDRKLDTKFAVVSVLGPNPEDFDDMKALCTRFNSLTKLKLFDPFMPMSKLAQCLSQLPQLVHVYLFYPTVDVGEEEEDEEEDEYDEEEDEHRAQRELSQVSSVRMLTLLFDIYSHHDYEHFFIADIFPNLQALRLKQGFIKCTDCAIVIPYGTEIQPELLARIVECTRLSRQPFRVCVHLHTVELSYHYNDDFKETLIDINQL